MSATNNARRVPLQRRKDSAYRQPVPSAPNLRGEAFARLIRDARTTLGISQDALAERTGLNRSTVIRWESGDASRPDPEQVRAVCKALGVDPRRAAVALGYLEPEDLNPADEGATKYDPTVEEVIQLLQDPDVPEDEKMAWIAYLRYLRNNAAQTKRRTG